MKFHGQVLGFDQGFAGVGSSHHSHKSFGHLLESFGVGFADFDLPLKR